MSRKAIYPGSFDPITHGHIDVAERALRLFDEVIVAIAVNDIKTPLFSKEERVDLLQKSLKDIKGAERIKIMEFDGLLAKFAKDQKVCAIIRGLRAVSDFEFEFQMALMNRKLEPSIETIFLMPKENYTYLSSRIVKEIARLNGDVRAFVPDCVAEALKRKLSLEKVI
jgi:pantetheine-phosphate adenylyltransferase